jgi:MFS family permease
VVPIRRPPVATFVVAATSARSADAGAVVAVVLAAAARADYPTYAAGLLAAAITAPHLGAPLLAHRLDAARDSRRSLSSAFACYAAATLVVAGTVGWWPWWAELVLVALTGAAGPLVTGGLSSLLAALVPADEPSQARAQGWDALTYGVAGAGGPAAVGLVATLWSPVAGLLVVAALVGVAAVLVWALPRQRSAPQDSLLPVRVALRLVASTGPLRRVALITMVASLVTGVVTVLAVLLGRSAGVHGALLVTVFGLGNLLASFAVTVRPSTREPERRVLGWVLVLAAAFAGAAVAPSPGWTAAAFLLAGASTAPYLTATLAARSRYSPPELRAMVFVSMAGVKVAAGSLGSAVAGLVAGLGFRTSLAVSGGVLVLSVAAAALDLGRSAGTART